MLIIVMRSGLKDVMHTQQVIIGNLRPWINVFLFDPSTPNCRRQEPEWRRCDRTLVVLQVPAVPCAPRYGISSSRFLRLSVRVTPAS